MKLPKKSISGKANVVNGNMKKRGPNLKISNGKKSDGPLGKKAKPSKVVKDLTQMSVDDFMSGNMFDSDDSEPDNEGHRKIPGPKSDVISKNNSKREKLKKGVSLIDFESGDDDSGADDISDDEESDDVNANSLNFNDTIGDNSLDCVDESNDGEDQGSDDEDSGDSNVSSDSDQQEEDNIESGDDDAEDGKDYADIPGGAVDDEDEEQDDMNPSAHKKSLQRLRASDPEFYKYLEENDKKLLQFNESDSDDEDEQEDESLHKPSEDLEVASDESDFEGDDEQGATTRAKEGVISLKMVRGWQESLQTSKTIEPIATAVQAFHAALIRVTDAEEPWPCKVDGSAVFNAVVQMCVLELQPAIKRFLRIPAGASGDKIVPQKCKKWKKVKANLKSYLQDLTKLLSGVSSPHVVSVLLKHLHQMAPFLAAFPVLIQKVLKRLTSIWGSGEETTRVVAFLCIIRICTNQRQLLDGILKQMYLSYVSNVKFVSPNTLANINFMRRSLVEVYRLDEASSYQHVFLYIRQLAIHLRNALTLQKKESVQSVLNWQFIHSVHLWAELLGATANKTVLQPLLYPLVQVIIGTMKLIPTTQYYPLRFHCVQILIDLSKNTNTFIPILPFLLEVLSAYNFNKRPKKASMKPMDLTCMLRVSKVEQTEKNFKDAIVEQIYRLTLLCLANEAHSIAFPDIVVTPTLQIKKFLKECKVANYCKKMKSILDKIEENTRFIENERKNVTLNLQDRKAVDAFETNVQLKGTPLGNYCASFQKVNAQVMKKRATDNASIGDYDLPTLVKRKRKDESNDGPAVPFPSDSEEEDVNFGSPEPEKKRKRRNPEKKVKKVKPQSRNETDSRQKDDQPDIVQDLRLEDF